MISALYPNIALVKLYYKLYGVVTLILCKRHAIFVINFSLLMDSMHSSVILSSGVAAYIRAKNQTLKKRPVGKASFSMSNNEGEIVKWFINYLRHTIQGYCGQIVTASERKNKLSKERIYLSVLQ